MRRRFGRGWLCVVVASSVAVALTALVSRDAVIAVADSDDRGAPVEIAQEVVASRTETSRTFRLTDGSLRTELHLAPVNYRDASGDWMPIDSTLRRRADGSLENRAASVKMRIPGDVADGPVRVSEGERSVAFELRGAAGEASVSEDTATFHDALPGVTVAYESRNAALKETLTLDSAAAPRTYAFDIDLSAGLEPRLTEAGDVELIDGSGQRRFVVAAPWMKDAGGSVSRAALYRLERTNDGGWLLRLELDDQWVDDPARRFPVVVDPTVYPGPRRVCELVSGDQAGVSRCSTSATQAWIGREGGRVHRAVAKFDTAPVPADAQVKSAEVSAWYADRSATGPVQIDTHALTSAFAIGATWNQASPGTSWTTPGGDFSPERETRRELGDADFDWWHPFGIARLQQDWLDRSRPNHGVLMKAADETLARVDLFEDIHMRVDWVPRLGNGGGGYTLERFPLDTGSEVAVNIGNGNLIASATDVDLRAAGSEFALTRTYNRMDWFGRQTFGVDWRDDHGVATRLTRNWQDGSYTWQAPDGGFWNFHKKPDGTFTAPDGLEAELDEHTDGTLSLRLPGETWEYDDFEPHYLERVVYRDGYTIDPTSDSDGIVDIADSEGHRLTFTEDAADDVRLMRDEAGREWHYDYAPNHALTAVTDPDDQRTEYEYTGENLTKITAADQSVTSVTYDSSQRVVSLTENLGTSSERSTGFAYQPVSAPCDAAAGDFIKTVVTPSDGRAATYCHNSALLASQITQGATPPVVQLSGSLAAADGGALTPGTTYELTITASEGAPGAAGTGVRELNVLADGELEDAAEQECPNGGCGLTRTISFDSDDYAAGRMLVQVIVTDQAGDRTDRCLRVSIPGEIEDADLDQCDRGLDPEMIIDDVPDESEDIPVAEISEDPDTCFVDLDAYPDTYCGNDDLPNDDANGFSIAAAEPFWGISDNNPTMWSDRRLIGGGKERGLGIRKARLIVPWDIEARKSEYLGGRYEGIRKWLEDANDAEYDIMVSFERSSRCGATCNSELPPVTSQGGGALSYREAAAAFLAEFPYVDAYSAWNEPNNTSDRDGDGLPYQPTAYEPYQAGLYFQELRRQCADRAPKCRVLAGELSDVHRMFGKDDYRGCFKATGQSLCSWIQAYRAGMGANSTRWAHHAYGDAKRRDGVNLRLDKLQKAIKAPNKPAPEIWLTEQGSVFILNGARRLTGSAARKNLRWMIDGLVDAGDGQIKRFYYYAWRGNDDFDSGLISFKSNKRRSLYRIYAAKTRG